MSTDIKRARLTHLEASNIFDLLRKIAVEGHISLDASALVQVVKNDLGFMVTNTTIRNYARDMKLTIEGLNRPKNAEQMDALTARVAQLESDVARLQAMVDSMNSFKRIEAIS